jgi:hypothetical protein
LDEEREEQYREQMLEELRGINTNLKTIVGYLADVLDHLKGLPA